MQCPKCSAEMAQFTYNNREFYVCTECKLCCGSDKVILQIDGSIITGLLVFLTLTSLIPIASGPLNNVMTILITASVVFPFAMSAIMVLSNHIDIKQQQRIEQRQTKDEVIYKLMILLERPIGKLKSYSDYATTLTFSGFVYLVAAIVLFLGFNVWSLISPTSPVIEVCIKFPNNFNMVESQCRMIKQGSLYEECVTKAVPDIQNVTGCKKFMVEQHPPLDLRPTPLD
jgi:hypothetical protein